MPRTRKPAKKAPAKKASQKKAAPRRRSNNVRVATLNVKHQNTLAEQKRDLALAMRKSGVISLSEVKRNGLLDWIRDQGWGVYMKSRYDTAVIWNKRRYNLERGETHVLNKETHGKGNLMKRKATAALLRDKRTGQQFWTVSVHLLPRRGKSNAPLPLKTRILEEQLETLSALMPELQQTAPVILSGDFNAPITKGAKARLVGGKTVDQWLKDMNLAGYVDVMGSFHGDGVRQVRSKIIGDRRLETDHGMFVGTFRIQKGYKPPKPPAKEPPKADAPNDGGGSLPKQPGLAQFALPEPPKFQGFWEGDHGGGPKQMAPGLAPKQNGAALVDDVVKNSFDPSNLDDILKPFRVEAEPALEVKPGIDPATMNEMLNKVSTRFFETNEW